MRLEKFMAAAAAFIAFPVYADDVVYPPSAEATRRGENEIKTMKEIDARLAAANAAARRVLFAAPIASERAKAVEIKKDVGMETYDLDGHSVECFTRDGRPICAGDSRLRR